MALPTCDDITQAANLAQEMATDFGVLATMVCTGDPGDYPLELVYEAKALALKNACLIVYNMRVDLAAYPLSASSVLLFDIET